MNVKISS